MPKFNDVAKLFAAKIGNADLQTAIEEGTVDEFEIDEDAFEGLKSKVGSLMTPDAALNNPEIINRMKDELHQNAKASIYGSVEKKMKTLGEKFGVEFAEGSRVDEMFESLSNVELPKGGSGKMTDEEKKQYNEEIKNLNNQLASIKTAHQEEIAKINQDYERNALNAAVDQKLSSFQFADAYQKDVVKRGIYQTIKQELNSKATLKLNNETGRVEVYQKENPDKRIFNENNQQVDFDSMVKPLVNDFLQKSNGVGSSKKVEAPKPQPAANPNSMMELMKKQRAEHFQN